MRLFRCLFALIFVCAMSGLARADDFKLGVQDAGPGIDYYGGLLTVGFTSCGYDMGCVTIENETGKTITSLLIDITANKYTVADGGGGCLDANCTYSLIDDGKVYQFLFTGLDIPTDTSKNDDDKCITGDTFTIVEEGLPAGKFPKAGVTSTVTPEPASLMLLATGFLLCAGFIYRRRIDAANLGS